MVSARLIWLCLHFICQHWWKWFWSARRLVAANANPLRWKMHAFHIPIPINLGICLITTGRLYFLCWLNWMFIRFLQWKQEKKRWWGNKMNPAKIPIPVREVFFQFRADSNQPHWTNNLTWKHFLETCLPVVLSQASVDLSDSRCDVSKSLSKSNARIYLYKICISWLDGSWIVMWWHI